MRTATAAAALAMMAAAPASAQTMAMPALLDATLLDVVAEGTTTRTPDIATIRAGVVTQAATAAQALSDNAARMTRVLVALKKAGVADRDIRTASIALTPQYKYGDNVPPVITGYQASNTVAIRFREIAKSGAILDALVAQGANQIDGPDLSIDNADAALDEARTDAIKRARARADLYARAAGLSVVRILSISEGGAPTPPPMPVMMMRTEAKLDSTQVSAGEQAVTATINVRFLLK